MELQAAAGEHVKEVVNAAVGPKVAQPVRRCACVRAWPEGCAGTLGPSSRRRPGIDFFRCPLLWPARARHACAAAQLVTQRRNHFRDETSTAECSRRRWRAPPPPGCTPSVGVLAPEHPPVVVVVRVRRMTEWRRAQCPAHSGKGRLPAPTRTTPLPPSGANHSIDDLGDCGRGPVCTCRCPRRRDRDNTRGVRAFRHNNKQRHGADYTRRASART